MTSRELFLGQRLASYSKVVRARIQIAIRAQYGGAIYVDPIVHLFP